MIEDALELRRETLGPHSDRTKNAASTLVKLYEQAGEPAKADAYRVAK